MHCVHPRWEAARCGRWAAGVFSTMTCTAAACCLPTCGLPAILQAKGSGKAAGGAELTVRHTPTAAPALGFSHLRSAQQLPSTTQPQVAWATHCGVAARTTRWVGTASAATVLPVLPLPMGLQQQHSHLLGGSAIAYPGCCTRAYLLTAAQRSSLRCLLAQAAGATVGTAGAAVIGKGNALQRALEGGSREVSWQPAHGEWVAQSMHCTARATS